MEFSESLVVRPDVRTTSACYRRVFPRQPGGQPVLAARVTLTRRVNPTPNRIECAPGAEELVAAGGSRLLFRCREGLAAFHRL